MYLVLVYKKIFKMSVKILNCSTLIFVGSCYLLRTLAIYVFTVCGFVWVCSGVEFRGSCSCYYVVPLSWCAG